MKQYCTQNQGDCETCSLVNYGRDCMNNPVESQVSEKEADFSAIEQDVKRITEEDSLINDDVERRR